MYSINYSNNKVLALTLMFLLIPNYVFAQSTPAEFAEMSLQELFSHSIDDTQPDPKKWSFSYSYRYGEFEGYLDGDSSLSFEDVLFRPADGETRTDKNFPVLPTTITQQVHMFNLGYAVNKTTNIQLSVPYIRQGTDHISIFASHPEFLIKSSGIGDVTLRGNFLVSNTNSSALWLGIGLSFPTGSIDEKGDTPRGPGDQQLPYTMQLGSGTYDIPLLLEYHYQQQWKTFVAATIRTGKNDRDYRLGNSISTGATYLFEPMAFFKPSLGISYKYTEHIHGRDNELLVPNPNFPFPAGITNPDLYGGEIISANTNFRFDISPAQRMGFDLSISLPVYQNLNGPQPKQRWTAELKYGLSF